MAHSEDNADLYQLVYVSRAISAIIPRFEQELELIVTTSCQNNSTQGVTGILVAHQRWFVQALEGAKAEVLALYEKIARDPRHELVQIISFEPLKQRRFGQWGMVAGRLPNSFQGKGESLNTLSAAELVGLLSAASPSADTAVGSDILDSLPEQQFDDLVSIARSLARAEAAALWMTDGQRSWLKSAVGLRKAEFALPEAALSHTLRLDDVVWRDNVLNAIFRFQAFAPLDVAGQRVGFLCVLDSKPRGFDPVLSNELAIVARSIVGRMEAQAEERTAARLLASSPDAILTFGSDFTISYCNPAAEALFGWASGAMVGQPVTALFPEHLRASQMRNLEAQNEGVSLGPAAQALTAIRSDGGDFPIELTLASWIDRGRRLAGVIIRDCTERKAAELALTAAKVAAEAGNVAKTAFLANMSHELRTPLNGMVSLAGILAESELSPRETEMAGLIRSSAEQLQHIVECVLEIARIDAGDATLTPETFSLHELATSLADLHLPDARAKGLDLTLEIQADPGLHVVGDAGKIRQIVSNLLSNAVKFTEAGSVSLTVSEQLPSMYRFTVRDTGVGFAPEMKSRLFTRFAQGDETLSRRFGGVGLGLAISRELTEMLGGEIDGESVPGGSVFSVLLPLEQAQTPFDVVTASETTLAPEADLHVLLADDNPTNRRVVELILGTLDAHVVSVEDGAQALKAVQHQSFTLVLMDMMMPVMDGLTATLRIRKLEQALAAPKTPVIMLSANTQPEHIAAAKEAGVDLYLTKPLTAPKLLEAMSAVLGGGDAFEIAA